MSDELKAARKELDGRVLGRSGVEGTAIGMHGGKPCLKVYLSSDEGRKGLPSKIRGVPVVPEKTGQFRKRDG